MAVDQTATFGDLLRRHRLLAGLSQEALAERATISADAVAALERGRRAAPRAQTVSLLADALGLEAGERERFVRAALGDRAPVAEVELPPVERRVRGAGRIPAPPSELIEREREKTAISQMLRGGARLITLTGPGGVGKTRLAIQVAAEMEPAFRDGAAFVDLSAVRDPNRAAAAVAYALELHETGPTSGRDLLVEQLRGRQLLLVLDNLEQVPDAGLLVSDLLAACREISILATSRAPLRLRMEQQFPVAPLGVPDSNHAALEELLGCGSMQLFVVRARMVQPDFRLTDENAEVVAEICRRLDGIPLAIELAAARVRLLPPQALLARLGRRLAVLVGGPRDLPARQQTLRDAIAWSHELLSAEAQDLFRTLAVFEGGFTSEAVAAVAGIGDDLSALQAVAELEEQNLIYAVGTDGAEPRFGMLQTIRDFAREQLECSGEGREVQRRHAEFFLRLAEHADPHLRSGARNPWMEHLSRESDNFRAALQWSQGDPDGAELGLRLAVALTWFWRFREWLAEGRSWLEVMLGRCEGQGAGLSHARALYGTGMLAWYEGDLEAAGQYVEEALALLRTLGDRQWTATTLRLLGLVRMGEGKPAAARPVLEESRALFHEIGDVWGEAMALYRIGLAAAELGDRTARASYEQSLVLFDRIGDNLGMSVALNALAVTAAAEGDDAAALEAVDRGLALARSSPERWDLARLLLNAGTLWLRQGEPVRARSLFAESLGLWRDIGYTAGICLSLAGLADVAVAQGEAGPAGRLYAVAAREYPADGRLLTLAGELDLGRRLEEARNAVDAPAFEAGRGSGERVSLDVVTDEVLGG